MQKDNVTRWYTESIYIDIDTGEKITSDNAKRNYTIIKKIKNTQINGQSGIVTFIYECKQSGQLKLW